MRLDCDTTERENVTLVACLLTNDSDEPRRVRVANRLDGPVWFPRVGGVPARGWDDGGYEGVLDVGETRPLGYATPTAPATEGGSGPAAEVVWSERAAHRDREATATDAARMLPDSRPPRAAIPEPKSALPPAVTAWLAGLEQGEVGLADRRALDAAARRIESIRDGDVA